MNILKGLSLGVFILPISLLFAQTTHFVSALSEEGSQNIKSIATAASNNAFIGTFDDEILNLDPTTDTLVLTSNGREDIFFFTYNTFGALAWVNAIGGTGRDEGNDIAIDSEGNILITGQLGSTDADFDPSEEELLLSVQNGVNSDIFLAKYTPKGALLWAFAIGNEGYEAGLGIALDNNDNIYITGRFDSDLVDFDPSVLGQNLLSRNGSADIFLASYDQEGNHRWAYNIGGRGFDAGEDITVSESNLIYITGRFEEDVDFDPSSNTNLQSSQGRTDVFLAQFDSEGQLNWVNSFGGSQRDQGTELVADQNDNIYVAGRFHEQNVDIDPSPSIFVINSDGDQDAFIAKFTPLGKLDWSYALGGSAADEASGLAIDEYGDIFLSGNFNSSQFDADPSGEEVLIENTDDSGDGADIFMIKFKNDGSYSWSTRVGGKFEDISNAIGLGLSDNILISGVYKGEGSLLSAEGCLVEVSAESERNSNAFVLQLHDNDRIDEKRPIFTMTRGEEGSRLGQFDTPRGVAVDELGNIFVADLGNRRIQKFDANLEPVEWGSSGINDGVLMNPVGVAISPSGFIYVTDLITNRIIKANNNGDVIATWGTLGSEDGQFNGLTGIAINLAGQIFVSELVNKRVQVFNEAGDFLYKWGTPGDGPGAFNSPIGVAIGVDNEVYVVDNKNSNVQRFKADGTYINQWGCYGNELGQFFNPTDIDVDIEGNVLVADANNNRIQKFNRVGHFSTYWSELGQEDDLLSNPGYLSIGDDGSLYVTDITNQIHRYNFLNLAALPVTLTEFKANQVEETVALNWTTESESNNAGFEVQRRYEQGKWEAVTFVPGQGTANQINRYQTFDVLSQTGTYYYRLKQIDFDESFEYSHIIALNWSKNGSKELTIFPNPVRNQLFIKLPEQMQEAGLWTSSGQLIRQLAIPGSADPLTISIEDLSPGIYIFKCFDGSKQFAKRFVKL